MTRKKIYSLEQKLCLNKYMSGYALHILASLAVVLTAITHSSYSYAGQKSAYTSFTIENDFFTSGGTDRHYTNGMRLTQISAPFDEFTADNTPGWLRELFADTSIVRAEDYQRSLAWGVGQIVVTPEDISLSIPQPGDLPYAGALYFFYALDGRNQVEAETISVIAGIAGPSSLGEQAQKLIHDLTNSDEPKGWDYQLKDEPLINTAYNYRRLLYNSNIRQHWNLDVIGTGSVYLGNLLTGGSIYFAAVTGHQNSYNPLNIQPDIAGRGSIHTNGAPEDGFFLLAGIGLDIYLYSILLDGNSFRDDSPSVEKETFVFNRFLGAGYNWGEVSMHIGWFDQSRLFKTQREGLEYGTINFTWRH